MQPIEIKTSVDFFKPTGKWYKTEYIKINYREEGDLKEIIVRTLEKADLNYKGFIVVCMNPISHPIMIIGD